MNEVNKNEVDLKLICNSIINACELSLNGNTDENIVNLLTLTYYKLKLIENKYPLKNDIMDYLSLGVLLLHTNEHCDTNTSCTSTSECKEN